MAKAKRESPYNLRIRTTERRFFEAAAADRGVSLATFLRDAAREAATDHFSARATSQTPTRPSRREHHA